jgi:uncharacterized lipoprotein YddW (UPF0748 family)
LTFVAVLALAGVREASAQLSPLLPQYRAFFVDTYNTPLNNAAEVATVVTRAQSAGANVLLVQVRRRGDAWYLQTAEPAPEGVAIEDGFDPLAELLARAHGAGIQVHAWVVLGTIWSQLTLPANPAHVFNQHGFTGAGVVTGRANWLTRTLQPDNAVTSGGGYRFGSDFWLDFGHPDAAAYAVAVVTQLVANYDIDGLHLDRVQYPDPTMVSGGPPGGATVAGGASVGYNDVSLERFRRRYGLPGDFMPTADDGAWSDWRRAQTASLVRRIYLEAVAIKPQLQVSADLVATGNSPAAEELWNATDAFSHTFQDWRAWLEEGIVDFGVPLNFRAEHQAANADAFNGWLAWTRDHQYQRAALMGLGAYENAIEGTLRQIRRSVESVNKVSLKGVAIYSMGAHNAPVNDNPYAVPSRRDTPYRSFEDLASGLKTGKTSAGQPLEVRAGIGVFAPSAMVVPFSWKNTPLAGHLKGTVKRSDGSPLDTADISIEGTSDSGAGPVTTTTDGSGFYGRVGLTPGTYRISVLPVGDGRYISNCSIDITAGTVASLDLIVDSGRPSTATCATQAAPAGRLVR